ENSPNILMERNGQVVFTPQYVRRKANSDMRDRVVILGQETPDFEMAIPFHPVYPHQQQIVPPNEDTKLLLETYSRFVCRVPHPEHPDWKVKKVRIYRVKHNIMPDRQFFWGMDPREPETFEPVYLGEYDASGKLLDPESPFLYWMLPIVRNDPTNINRVRNY